LQSPKYSSPISLPNGGVVKAIAVEGNKQSELAANTFGLSKATWRIIPDATIGLKPENAIDESNSLWSSLSADSASNFTPAQLSIDLGSAQNINAFTYLPRQDKSTAGLVDRYAFLISTDGKQWQQVAAGEFSNIKANPLEQTVSLKQPVKARYIQFKAMHVIAGNGATAAEIGVLTAK
jgi:alpha-L-fucosidase